MAADAVMGVAIVLTVVTGIDYVAGDHQDRQKFVETRPR